MVLFGKSEGPPPPPSPDQAESTEKCGMRLRQVELGLRFQFYETYDYNQQDK